jgi:hypothetical protein
VRKYLGRLCMNSVQTLTSTIGKTRGGCFPNPADSLPDPV